MTWSRLAAAIRLAAERLQGTEVLRLVLSHDGGRVVAALRLGVAVHCDADADPGDPVEGALRSLALDLADRLESIASHHLAVAQQLREAAGP